MAYKPTLKDQIAQVKSRINSKRGYIRYLTNRKTDKAPILAQIKRHEEEAAKHLARVAALKEMLNVDDALTKAQAELAELQADLRKLDPSPTNDLVAKMAKLEAALAEKGITL